MATFPQLNMSALSTATPGPQLTEQFRALALPPHRDKRRFLVLAGISAGATAAELFIDSIANFRVGLASNSTVFIEGNVVYYNAVAGSNVVFTITGGYSVVNNVVTALAAPTVTKIGSSTATFAVTISGNNLVFTGTGVAGDTSGRWECSLSVSEVTDVG